MWQGLYDELKDQNFLVIAAALDTREAAGPWIEKANPDYPTLIDVEHRLAEIYNFVNVPQAAWIDESGRMVRPPETAGAYEAFRYRDAKTGQAPADEMEKRDRARRLYYDAVRDWVAKGPGSCFVMENDEARRHLARPTSDTAKAHALFRLGSYLLQHGRKDEAARHMAEASRQHPASWAMWRQAAPKTAEGYAADETFWQRVQALGEQRYYPPPPMEGMP